MSKWCCIVHDNLKGLSAKRNIHIITSTACWLSPFPEGPTALVDAVVAVVVTTVADWASDLVPSVEVLFSFTWWSVLGLFNSVPGAPRAWITFVDSMWWCGCLFAGSFLCCLPPPVCTVERNMYCVYLQSIKCKKGVIRLHNNTHATAGVMFFLYMNVCSMSDAGNHPTSSLVQPWTN